MAFPTTLSTSAPTRSRRRTKLHLAFCILGVATAFGAPSGTVEENTQIRRPWPAQITQPAKLPDAPSVTIVDGGATSVENWSLPWSSERELRTKHKRQNKEDKNKPANDDEGQAAAASEEEDDGEEDSTKSAAPTKTISEDLDDVNTLTVSTTSSPTSTSAANESPLPLPFDGAIASDFKGSGGDESCPDFMTALLTSSTFKECYPLSMMIQTSTSFFNARKQLTSTIRVLEASCAADVSSCTDFMDAAARNLTSQANCKEEFDNGLSAVMQAYRGLQTYNVLYSVSCLQNPESADYCFANSVTNPNTPSDAYLYFLPYGLSLPGSSTPTCDWCTQETMGIFHSASAYRAEPISDTYEQAALQVNTICGLNYVNGTLPEPRQALGSVSKPTWAAVMTAMGMAVLLNTLL